MKQTLEFKLNNKNKNKYMQNYNITIKPIKLDRKNYSIKVLDLK